MRYTVRADFVIGTGTGAPGSGGAIVSTSLGGSPGLGGSLLGQPVGGSLRGHQGEPNGPISPPTPHHRHPAHVTPESRHGPPQGHRRPQAHLDPYTTLGPDDYRLTDQGPLSAGATTGKNFTAENSVALRASAGRIGTTPQDLAKTIAYETEGSFSPSKWGGKGGRHMGLIQFGPNERRQYGAYPNQSFGKQLGAVERYLKDRGFKPGMGLPDLYSTVLAGRPGLYNRRDSGGSVTQHVARMQRERAAQAERFLAAGDAASRWLGGEPPEAARFTGGAPSGAVKAEATAAPASSATPRPSLTSGQSVIPGQRDPHEPGFDTKSVPFLGKKAAPNAAPSVSLGGAPPPAAALPQQEAYRGAPGATPRDGIKGTRRPDEFITHPGISYGWDPRMPAINPDTPARRAKDKSDYSKMQHYIDSHKNYEGI